VEQLILSTETALHQSRNSSKHSRHGLFDGKKQWQFSSYVEVCQHSRFFLKGKVQQLNDEYHPNSHEVTLARQSKQDIKVDKQSLDFGLVTKVKLREGSFSNAVGARSL
jgi:hypothetical protein